MFKDLSYTKKLLTMGEINPSVFLHFLDFEVKNECHEFSKHQLKIPVRMMTNGETDNTNDDDDEFDFKTL